MKRHSVVHSAMLIVFIVEIFHSVIIKKGLPSLKFFFSAGIAYLGLALLDEVTEDLAKDLAVAMTVYVVLNDGAPTLTAIMAKVPSTSTTGSVAANSPAQSSAGVPGQTGAPAKSPGQVTSNSKGILQVPNKLTPNPPIGTKLK